MKTKLFTLALAALTIGLLGSCEKDGPQVDPQTDPYFSVSPEGPVVVSKDGGEFTLTINTNCEFQITDYHDGSYPWQTAVLADDKKTVTVTIDKNNDYVPRQSYVKFTIPAIRDQVVDEKGNPIPGETLDHTVRVYFDQDGLAGKFTVNAEGKQVLFSRGNLYWDGDSFQFETNQYDVQDSWSTSHVSHFYWSKTASVAYAESYSESGTSDSDVLFTNADGFTVNVGGAEQSGWRTLSKDEWTYLFNTRTVNGGTGKDKSYSLNITYGGKMGLVLYPDNYTGSVLSGTVEALPEGIVFLPAAGYRNGSDVNYVGVSGDYWSSTAIDENFAYFAYFNSSNVTPDYRGYRHIGYSVRLITESK